MRLSISYASTLMSPTTRMTKEGDNVVDGGKTLDTSYYSAFLPSEDTSLETCSGRRGNQCSRHACCE